MDTTNANVNKEINNEIVANVTCEDEFEVFLNKDSEAESDTGSAANNLDELKVGELNLSRAEIITEDNISQSPKVEAVKEEKPEEKNFADAGIGEYNFGGFEEPFKYDEKEDNTSDLRDIINRIKMPFTLPSGRIINIITFLNYVARNKNKISNILFNLTEEEKLLLGETEDTIRFVSKEFMGDINNEDLKFVNSLKYGDNDTGIRSVKDNPVEEGNKKANVGRFLSIIGLGNNIDIPLYHSGFRITCRPPSQADFSKLEFDVYNAEVAVGRDTSGFITSNRKGFATDLAATLITECIYSTTLKLEEGEDILKYISILDFNIILLGLIQGSNPNKIDIQRPCSNIYTVKDEQVVCGKFVTGTLNPGKLLFVNTDIINDEMISIIGRKGEGSVSKEDREYYLKIMRENTKKLQKINNVEIPDKLRYYPIRDDKTNYLDFQFKIPSIYDYLNSSNYWINTVKSEIESVFDANTTERRKDIIERISINNSLSVLSSNIESLFVARSGETVTNIGAIISYVNSINYGDEVLGELNSSIQRYVAASMFAICAIPNYTCPSCRKKQEIETEVADQFKNFIPVDMLDFFFRLTRHRNEKMEALSTP